MKNKLIIFFSCLGIMFFVGNFCLADSDLDTYYENKQAESQAAAAEAERDAYNESVSSSKAGASCGSNNVGTCMTGSFSCPDGSSWVMDMTNNCASGYRCCKANLSSGTAKDKNTENANLDDPFSGLNKENIGAGTTAPVGTGAGIYIPESTGLPSNTVQGVLKNLLTWLLGTMGILAMIGFIISGIMYIMSSGNDDMITKAKSGFKYSVIGITVALSSFIIIQAVQYALQGTSWF